jgi:3-hydroxymyristoyl/3-hydroxydecanoyl-(acyl carrier protein) dehydratase/1-acyl-sn-glycerol-3-phosphate acyltransferase
MALSHVRSPRIPTGPLLLLERVSCFDPHGGPWKRGYLRVERRIRGDEWFFPGHFKDDPTMPGTLMAEGCVQAMAFYLAALGYTADKDGWRFEPVPGEPYPMACRGQVTPTSREIVFEIFVDEVIAAPQPTLFADALLTVDGLKAFHCRRFGLRLVPDWPLTSRRHLLTGHSDPDNVASVDGVRFGYASMLACAWGKPSDAFGPRFSVFDEVRRTPRLPGPPYHFMSRVTRIDAEPDILKAGATVEAEYDIPSDAWYFLENGDAVMPFCVLLECGLQPCGWLAAFLGVPLQTEVDLSFRNLDGTGLVSGRVTPDAGTLRSVVTLTSISRSGDTFIEFFDVRCFLGDTEVYAMKTVFGHFPRAALAEQVGLPADPDELSYLQLPANVTIDLRQEQPQYLDGGLRLPRGRLLMLDRITGLWPDGGRAGRGRLRAEMDVDPAAWFFKAHFFQDPVQPGSLGMEVMLQLLQFYMLHRGMGVGMTQPEFRPLAGQRLLTWKYRGQVLPSNCRVIVDMEILDVAEDEDGPYAVADASLWVDGTRIYHVQNISMAIVSGAADSDAQAPVKTESAPNGFGLVVADQILDPSVDTWLRDHCPTYTLPALPLTFMANQLAEAAQGQVPDWHVVGLEDVRAHQWLVCDKARQLRTETRRVEGRAGAFDVTLLAWREASVASLSRYEPVATGRVLLAPGYPAPSPRMAPLTDAQIAPNPYATHATIHGSAFHLLRELRYGTGGCSATLEAGTTAVPIGAIGQLLLDGITHAMPMANLWKLSPTLPRDRMAYPTSLRQVTFHRDVPSAGEVRCEVRFAGFEKTGSLQTPAFQAQLIVEDRVWAEVSMLVALFPKGPLGSIPGRERRAFMRNRSFVPGVRLSQSVDGSTVLRTDRVKTADWFPGTISYVYGAEGTLEAMTRVVAVKEHVASQLDAHPSTVRVSADEEIATCSAMPLTRYPIKVTFEGANAIVSDSGPPTLDVRPVRDYRRAWFGGWPRLLEDLSLAVILKFLRRVVLTDPEALARVHGRPVLYLANHQVHLESALMMLVTPALFSVPVTALARTGIHDFWITELLTHAASFPDIRLPPPVVFIDQRDGAAALRTLEQCGRLLQEESTSVMVHVEGKRSVTCRRPVEVMSSTLIDLALRAEVPIVPLRFVGGLPPHTLDRQLHAPYGYGSQDFYFGPPVLPEQLGALPYVKRRQLVLDAINGLGPSWKDEQPNPPDEEFAAGVSAWTASTGTSEEDAVLLEALKRFDEPGSEALELLEATRSGCLTVSDTPEGQWMADLARRLFGERGPRVVVHGQSDA